MARLRPLPHPAAPPAIETPDTPGERWARAPAGTTGTLRRGLLALVGLSMAGLAVELAMLRHWHGVLQLLPWGAITAVAGAATLLAVRPTRSVVRGVRAIALAVALLAVAGVYVHVAANYESGPLDQAYTAVWEGMSEPARWWAAASMTVGPAPPVAPGVLGQSALGLLLATAGLPARAPRR